VSSVSWRVSRTYHGARERQCTKSYNLDSLNKMRLFIAMVYKTQARSLLPALKVDSFETVAQIVAIE
jgi:hypothetical protein